MSHGNSLYSYLKQIKISFCCYFVFTKTENRRLEQVLSGDWHQWEEEGIRKGMAPVGGGGYKERVWEVKMVEIWCAHICKWENETC
jgi:hypothetical protein